MIYRGPGFLAVVWFGYSPVRKLFLFFSLLVCVAGWAYWLRGWERSQILRRRESLVLFKWFNTPWVLSYVFNGDKREQRKGLRAELRQDIRMPNVTQVTDADEDFINVTSVAILEMWVMCGMWGCERNVTHYEECEGWKEAGLWEMWKCEEWGAVRYEECEGVRGRRQKWGT